MSDAGTRPPARPLARRYALTFGAITLILLGASGALEMLFGYREARHLIARLQAVQAEAASKEIDLYLRTIEQGVRDATKLPWGRPGFGLEQKREEYARLMSLMPAVMELHEYDAAGAEQLLVSRSELDRVRSGRPAADDLRPLLALHRPGPSGALPSATVAASAPGALPPAQSAPARYSPTFYREGAAPFVHIALPDNGPAGSVTVATVNLRFLADVVSGLRVGENGRIYLVDSASHLIAHPRPTHALRKLDLAGFAPVAMARQALAAERPAALQAMDSVDIEGLPVIVTALPVAAPGWLVFVEQPRSEALAPVLATLQRTLLLLALGGGLAVLASIAFARRMAAPIVELSRAARQVAAGALDTRITARTGDEVERLADDFNHMADELQAAYKGLEDKVASRTAELKVALDEVGQRRDEAERASAAKTRFLAAASHDLRQPMHSIGLLVGVLRGRQTAPESLVLADKVQHSVSVMESLFSSLLDISKLDAGAVRPAPEAFAIGPLLQQLDALFAPQAQARGLRLRVRPCAAMVHSDPALLHRMLANLVSNAIRYSRQGGVLVAARRRGDRLALQVVDTGIGIAAEHLEKIFDEFERLHDTAGDDAKGLGLGLSIVKRSAELLGHPLSVRSVPGRGSTFEIRVPGVAAPASASVESPGRRAPAPLQRGFVLVVDDDADNRLALELQCREWGCTVLAVPGPVEALSQLTQHMRPPDLILTDHRLGSGHDGFGLIEAVRRSLDEPVPAIVITADTGDALAVQAQRLQARLLHKPASADTVLEAMLALWPAQEAAPGPDQPADDPSG